MAGSPRTIPEIYRKPPIDVHLTVEPFQYSELQDGDIRLFCLHQGGYEDPVRIQLSHYRLNNAPRSCALSYVWGSPTQTDTYLCEDQSQAGVLPLTSSLCGILRSIRAHNFSGGLPLWIDQVCINQKHNAKKARQVKIMGQLYSRAETTLIHLAGDGSDDKEITSALENIIRDDTRSCSKDLRARYGRISQSQAVALSKLNTKS